MPLFEFEAGRLVPAQAGHTLGEPIEPAVLDAVRDQLLELVGVSVFPVAWQEEAGTQWLTAMTADGRPVAMEVVDRLDAATFVAALSRLGRTAATSWSELAELYPHGVGAFRRDWNAFREAQPPAHTTETRLHIVAARVDEDVRPAITALAGSGVVVHELAARVMSSGRLFLDVAELRAEPPRLPWLVPGSRRASLPVADGPAARVERPSRRAARRVDGAGQPAEIGRAPKASQPSSTTQAAPATPATPPRPAPSAEPAAGDDEPVDDLRLIGRSLDAEAPLLWQRDGQRHEARLTPQGFIVLGDGRSFGDPDRAATALGDDAADDAWSTWRFGEQGPSLHEARTELRAHRDRPEPPAGGQRVSRRSRRRRAASD